MIIGSTDGALIGTMAACETRANASECPPTWYTALQADLTGWHWPAIAGIGAGDGNRTHTGGASEPFEQAVWCDCGFQVWLACEISRYVGQRRDALAAVRARLASRPVHAPPCSPLRRGVSVPLPSPCTPAGRYAALHARHWRNTPLCRRDSPRASAASVKLKPCLQRHRMSPTASALPFCSSAISSSLAAPMLIP